MRKFFPGLAALVATCLVSGNLWAVPDSSVAEFDVEVYDTGGQLNFVNNGGFYLNGLEVDPAGGTVYVAASDAIAGSTSSVVRLIGSTGPGTAALDASGTRPLEYTTRGVDLTYLSGSYYVAACAPAGIPNKGGDVCQGISGVYGFTPGGGQPTYASGGTIPSWATSGLTFNAGGASALVTSDVGIGHWNVTPPSTGTLLVNDTPLPGGYVNSGDDHVVTLDGRVLIMADGGSAIYDVTGGPGSVFLFFDMTTIPGFPGCGVGPPPKSEAYDDKEAKGGPCFGSRGTVDPVTGDIFYAYAVGGATIFRITPNGAFGEVFATGFVDGVVDIDFGPASDGGGDFSLYATEVNGVAATGKGTSGPVGSIYEFVRVTPGPIPTLSNWGKLAMILALLGIAGYMLSRRQRGLA